MTWTHSIFTSTQTSTWIPLEAFVKYPLFKKYAKRFYKQVRTFYIYKTSQITSSTLKKNVWLTNLLDMDWRNSWSITINTKFLRSMNRLSIEELLKMWVLRNMRMKCWSEKLPYLNLWFKQTVWYKNSVYLLKLFLNHLSLWKSMKLNNLKTKDDSLKVNRCKSTFLQVKESNASLWIENSLKNFQTHSKWWELKNGYSTFPKELIYFHTFTIF